jgi:hypothetical protein
VPKVGAKLETHLSSHFNSYFGFSGPFCASSGRRVAERTRALILGAEVVSTGQRRALLMLTLLKAGVPWKVLHREHMRSAVMTTVCDLQNAHPLLRNLASDRELFRPLNPNSAIPSTFERWLAAQRDPKHAQSKDQEHCGHPADGSRQRDYRISIGAGGQSYPSCFNQFFHS